MMTCVLISICEGFGWNCYQYR